MPVAKSSSFVCAAAGSARVSALGRRCRLPLLLLVTSCAASNGSTPAGPTRAGQSPNLENESWLLRNTPPDEHDIAWSHYDELRAACWVPPGKRDPLSRPLAVVSSEEEYRRLFCTESSIDWDHHRLVVYSEGEWGRRALAEDVIRQGEDLVFVLRRSSICEATTYEWTYLYVPVLVPAGDERVRMVFRDQPDAPC
jgi:hypothetical protein